MALRGTRRPAAAGFGARCRHRAAVLVPQRYLPHLLCRAPLGAVSYRIEWPGLLAEEKRAGWILPCVAHPATDLVIEQSHASRAAEG